MPDFSTYLVRVARGCVNRHLRNHPAGEHLRYLFRDHIDEMAVELRTVDLTDREAVHGVLDAYDDLFARGIPTDDEVVGRVYAASPRQVARVWQALGEDAETFPGHTHSVSLAAATTSYIVQVCDPVWETVMGLCRRQVDRYV